MSNRQWNEPATLLLPNVMLIMKFARDESDVRCITYRIASCYRQRNVGNCRKTLKKPCRLTVKQLFLLSRTLTSTQPWTDAIIFRWIHDGTIHICHVDGVIDLLSGSPLKKRELNEKHHFHISSLLYNWNNYVTLHGDSSDN